MLSIVFIVVVVVGFFLGTMLIQQVLPEASSNDQVSSEGPALDARRGEPAGVGASPVPTTIPSNDEYGIPAEAPSDPRMAFLLLGYGGGSHEGAYLTDSIMVAIADPTQKTITLLSVPRDSWVPLLFDGKTAVYSKLNTAYAYAKDSSLYRNRLARYNGSNGAGNFAADTLSRVLGVPIPNYLGLDFQGFRQMIDAVGGVDVDVPASFAALYPANDDPSIDPSWTTVRFTKGVEHMNGARAIQYARAREAIDNINEGSDFARSRRQRIVMEAFRKRLFEPNGLIHLPQIMAIMARHVDTDYTFTEAGQLGRLIMDWKDVRIYQTALTTANYLTVATGPGGAFLLVPSAPDHTWGQIRAFARRLWQDPAAGVAMADTRIVVVNDTGESGLAMRLSETLMNLGYRVGPPVSGQQRAESRLVDRTGGKANLVVAQLENDLGVRFETIAETPLAGSDELLLYLGANDKYLADLPLPADDAAPSSAPGVVNFGGWVPYVALPTPTPTLWPLRTITTPTALPSVTQQTTENVEEAAPPTPSSSDLEAVPTISRDPS